MGFCHKTMLILRSNDIRIACVFFPLTEGIVYITKTNNIMRCLLGLWCSLGQPDQK